MAKQRFEAEVPDGMRLGFAQGSEGGVRGLLFDEETNALIGHAEFFELDDDYDSWDGTQDGGPRSPEPRDEAYDEFVAVVSAALAQVVIHGLAAAAPHVKRWWLEKAAPTLVSTPAKVRSKLTRRAGNEATVSADAVEEVGVEAVEPAMSSAEARQRFHDAVVAMAYAQQQMNLLHNARITDEDDSPLELAATLRELSPQRVEEAIRLMLVANPSMLDRENVAAFKTTHVTARLSAGPLPLGQAAPEDPTRAADE